MKKARIIISILLTMSSILSASAAVRGQLYAGAAKEDITPDVKDLPNTSYGILDHCYTRAISFTNGDTKAAFISFDAGMINARLVEEINRRAAAELGIAEGNIMYNWTHTHSGSTVKQEELVERTWKALKQADANLVPAKVGYGSGVSYLNVKRDLFDPERGTWWEGPDYDGKSDKTVAVIYFESLEGKPIATYFNYAMHAVISGNLDMVSGDFPGAASRYIESRYGDDFVAVCAVGAAGDQNPLYFQQTFDLRDIRIADYAKRGEDISNKMPPGGQGMDRSNPEVARLMNEQKMMVESYGQLLGEEVKYVIMMMRHFETDVTISCLHKQLSCPGRRQTNGGGRAGYAGEYEDAPDAIIDLHLTMIDDIPVVGTSGEPYNPIAVRLKKESPYSRTMLTMLCQGAFTGYIPDDESYGAQSFEVLGSRFKQGYAESAIVNGALDLIHEATHN
ncbi:MAG: neutral/alkaline non-lysosomal ceramidase N-terminal domain-containing protein [Bacteroidales bacterium]|nr:neutral/alkaline non-lysosomal ceramidase N-terminal domain-containing protein [Bacteroidales bacterium]